MTSELFWLVLTAVLAASLWIPYIVGVNMNPVDAAADFRRPPDLRQFPEWVHRAHRAHLNLIEQGMPFALLVLIAHLAGVSNGWTVGACIAFFWLRALHAAGMIAGFARFPLRPLIFTGGWLCSLVVAVSLFVA